MPLGGASGGGDELQIGQDLGRMLGGAERGVVVEDDPLEVFARSQAVLDFTTPAATI